MRARKASRPAAEFSANGPRRVDRFADAIDFVATIPTRGNQGNAIRAEIVGGNYCFAEGYVARSRTPVLSLCRQLLDAGFDPATPLELYRGDVLCLIVNSIGEASKIEINGRGTGFVYPKAVGTAPPTRENELPAPSHSRRPA